MRVLWLLPIAACGRVDFASTPDAARDPSLVVHLPLDTIGSAGSPDASGNGHGAHCDVGQCPGLAAGRIDGALSFDGDQQRLVIDDAPDLDLPNDFTVAIWLQMARTPTITGCPYQKLVGTFDQDTWELCINPDLSAYFFTSETAANGNGDLLSVSVPVTVGAWHHMAITWDATLRRKELWLDGGRIGDSEDVALTPLFDSQPILLGLDIDSGVRTSAFVGNLDDFRIYSRVLAPAELAALAMP